MFFLCAHPFLPLSLLLLCLPVFKKETHSCPISRGSLSSYAESIAHHFSSFITLTISQESWRHYATRCNTITSLSHFSVVAKAGTVSSNTAIQQIQMSPRTRETRCDFLPLPDNQSHTVAGLAISNYFMPLGSACTGRHGIVLEKNEEDWQPGSIPQELIRLPD